MAAATTPAAGVHGAGEVSVRITAAAAAGGGGGELQRRERTLNRFVRVVAFWEWAGNAFGALAFLWATGVLLGGFCSDLKSTDFWFAMVIIFIEAFRYIPLLSTYCTTHQLDPFFICHYIAARLLARRHSGVHTCLYIANIIYVPKEVTMYCF